MWIIQSFPDKDRKNAFCRERQKTFLFVGGDDVKVGAPFVEGATVTAKVEKQGRQKKVIVYKYKRRKNYHRKQGHRQPYTKLVIEKINA